VRACQTRTHPQFQRLEFLGDRVLTMLLGALLFEQFPEDNEGALSKRYAYLASSTCMHDIGVRSNLLPLLLSMNTEPISEKRLVAEALEAIVGAVYLDGGIVACRQLVERLWQEDIVHQPLRATIDAKTHLQEWAMQKNEPMPEYTLIAEKEPSSSTRFTVKVTVGKHSARAQASKKRDAEKKAAATLLKIVLPLPPVRA